MSYSTKLIRLLSSIELHVDLTMMTVIAFFYFFIVFQKVRFQNTFILKNIMKSA